MGIYALKMDITDAVYEYMYNEMEIYSKQAFLQVNVRHLLIDEFDDKINMMMTDLDEDEFFECVDQIGCHIGDIISSHYGKPEFFQLLASMECSEEINKLFIQCYIEQEVKIDFDEYMEHILESEGIVNHFVAEEGQ
jgi:hypothetical protein